MSKVEKAVQFMEQIAKDDRHGYDQIYRWGEKGDYDCSALVITAFEKVGFPVKTKYGATYTGNMKKAFLKCGFKDIISSINLTTGQGLKRGDILLNTSHHTAVYCGNNKIVQASINEKGTIAGGNPGDQTGREINISKYKNYWNGGWKSVLRYEEEEEEMIEQTDFLIDNKKVKIKRILKDNTNYVNIRDLENIGLFKVDYDQIQKLPIIKSK